MESSWQGNHSAWPLERGGAPVQTIDQNKFFAKAERTALCSLTNELNGRVEDFGETFWRFVSQRSPLVGGRLERNTPLVSIEYSDRYLNSPLPVRLLAEVIAHAPGMSSSSAVKLITTDQVSNFSSSSPTLLKHDWQVLKHRDNVLQGGLSGALGGRFTHLKQPKFDVPHGRVLRLKFADGGSPSCLIKDSATGGQQEQSGLISLRQWLIKSAS